MSNQFIDAMRKNDSLTNNGMLTHSSSNNPILNMFFLLGAMRDKPDNDIITIFVEAFNEDEVLATKLLAYFRDIDKGCGERRIFRTILRYMWNSRLINMKNNVHKIVNNLDKILVLNIARVDDYIWLANEILKSKPLSDNDKKMVTNILNGLMLLLDHKKIGGIVAKWMPRKHGKYSEVVKFMRKNGVINTYSDYRRVISHNSHTVEQQMSKNDWSNINLEKVPSIAMKKYKKAFLKRNLLLQFVKKVAEGSAKINAKKLTPGDIMKDIVPYVIRNAHNVVDLTIKDLLNEQWKNLQNIDDLPNEFRAIPMIDVSESMYNPNYIPISNSLGIGMFIAEHNPNKEFKDYFITFTDVPRFHKLTGYDIFEKATNAAKTIGYNTNISAAFDLLLRKAVNDHVNPEDMPTHIIIISDMEFDNYSIHGKDLNSLQMIKHKYDSAGYEMPQIVYWNVNGRIGNVPAKVNDNGVILVSGASQNVVNFILKQGYENPMELVYEIANQERYAFLN